MSALLESTVAILHSMPVRVVLATAIGTTPDRVVSQSMCHLFVFFLARCLANLDFMLLLAEPT